MARLRRLLPVIALALGAACAHVDPPAPAPAPPPAPPAPAPPPDPVAPIRAEVEALLSAQGEILWHAWITGEPGDPSRALSGRELLHDPGALAAVREARGRATGAESRALSLLEAFLAGERLTRESAASADRLAAARAQATVTWEGRELPLRKLPALLAAEDDAGRRARIEEVAARAEARLRPLAEEQRRALDAAARKLGAASARELAAAWRGEPLAALAARAEAVLAATEAPYRALMEGLARRELNLPLARLRARDLPRLFALAQEPRAFPAAAAAPRALDTLRGLGVDLASRPGVILDLAARPGKEPRPLLLPVEVPAGVRVSAAPAGGVAEARALLRVLGSAAYFSAITAPELEFRRLGPVTADAWGALFEELAGDPAWLAEKTGLSPDNLEPVVLAAAARRLHQVRDAAARLLYEAGRPADTAGAEGLARAVAARAFLHPVEAAEAALWTADADPLLRSADALDAALLAAQAEAWLARLGGPSWWRSEQAGTALRAAWAQGSRLSPGELSRAFGFARLDAAALVDACRARGERAGLRVPVPAAPAGSGPATGFDGSGRAG